MSLYIVALLDSLSDLIKPVEPSPVYWKNPCGVNLGNRLAV